MKLWKKITIGVVCSIVGLVAIGAITVVSLWHNEISSVSSIKQIVPEDKNNKSGPVYEMNVSGDYYFDNFLKQGGAKNDQELIDYIVKNITKGIIPISIKAPTIGCSSFTAIDKDTGHRLFARNYDFTTTSSMIIRTDPGEGRHKSISSVDLQFLGIKPTGFTDLKSKIIALAGAYAPLDGMNDAGVSCGIYMSYQKNGVDKEGKPKIEPTDQNTDKPDLTSTTMLRMILDYADDVDEAIELVQKYDFHDSANTSFHYMVADKKGNSAILEWYDGTDKNDDGSKRTLHVIRNNDDSHLEHGEGANDFQYITNFLVSPNYYVNDKNNASKGGFDRYEAIPKLINPDGKNPEGKITKADALKYLETLGRRKWDPKHGVTDSNGITVWSSLYDLDDLSSTWVSNEQFEMPDRVFNYKL